MALNFSEKDKASAERATGRGRIAFAREGHTMFPFDKLSNKERLSLTRKGTKEMLAGTQKLNILRKPDPEIAKLEKVILRAAAGKPLKKSISAETKKQEEQEAKTVFILLQRLLGGINVEEPKAETNAK